MTDIWEHVEVCPLCEGTGKTVQTYTHGCGMGYYSAKGPCWVCGKQDPWQGTGYVYKGTCDPVPPSVVAQIQSTKKGGAV